jgi:hypothetical protein
MLSFVAPFSPKSDARLRKSRYRKSEVVVVKKLLLAALISSLMTVSAYAQAKGVDEQNVRIRDSGSESTPGHNGAKQDTGAGRGINFGKGRTPDTPVIANPYRFTARREALIEGVKNLIRDRGMILDEAASRPDEGIFITQPYTFTKGAVVSQAELNRYTDLPPSTGRGWTRGRYTLVIEIQAIDSVSANVAVTAKIEGRTDGATGAEWATLRSLGVVEQEFLTSLIENVTGSKPVEVTP